MMSAPAPYPTVQSSAPAPDDHEISTRTPSICVDYLSHNWTDEDVWSSWKAMTKRKNEIANGVRLENASWRTWAKQRGKLKTISPETLNWLKDSDVTWLYGPLHEHVESVPPPKVATARETLDLEDSIRTKSILKHRTISEMLTTPGRNASPMAETPPALGSGPTSREGSISGDERPSRPAMHPVKSETALHKMRAKGTGGSPPASERLFRNLATGDKEDGIPHPEERRHISFNQRVDQCIAVDAEEEEEAAEEEDDGQDEDGYSDGMYDRRDDDEGSSSDEEVLTMKSSPRSAPSWPTMASAGRNSTSSLEHQTIAKLAPTMLKTSDTFPAPSPQVVDPSGFTAHFNGTGATGLDGQPQLSAQPQVYQYGAQEDEMAQTRYSQWDADDDFNGDFDYFNGPDLSDSYPNHQVPQANESNATPSEDRGSDSSQQDPVPAAPKGILKKRASPKTVGADEVELAEGTPATLSPPLSPESASSSTFSSPNKERGRTSQRGGSSASYERIQDATRASGSAGAASTNRTRSTSSGGSPTSSDINGSVDGTFASSPPHSNVNLAGGKGSTERRESFRKGAGEGSRAMGPSAKQRDNGNSEMDSDGRASLDFNSPGYPASPLLGDKDGDSDSSDEAKLYGRKKDSSRWADSRGKQSGRGGGAHASRGSGGSGRRGLHSDDDEARGGDEEGSGPSQRLSVDLENLPSNTVSPPGSAPGGPTPLNTPTFSLARAQRSGKRSGGHIKQGSAGSQTAESGAGGPAAASSGSVNDEGEAREPTSPVLPRRSSATGALVAPSDADKDAGVRVPLAHDYVEEDEGGIVGRAVEIVNTARDLIGALLGTGGDRGRSWREGN